MKKRVVVGLSGGVDSSVAAYLLQQEGYEVIGLFMKNWHDDSVTISNECPWLEDSNDALLVAEKLGIPFQTVDLSEQYQEKIVDYMFSEYEKGRTPNPDPQTSLQQYCRHQCRISPRRNWARRMHQTRRPSPEGYRGET